MRELELDNLILRLSPKVHNDHTTAASDTTAKLEMHVHIQCSRKFSETTVECTWWVWSVVFQKILGRTQPVITFFQNAYNTSPDTHYSHVTLSHIT